jgi:integrase/recombinase XerD
LPRWPCRKGISLAAVQKILGHERLGTTAIYLNLTDLHVVEEYAQVVEEILD